MSAQFDPKRDFRLVFKTSRLTVAVVLCTAVLSAAALLTLHFSLQSAETRADALREQAAALEQENGKLETQIQGLGSVDSVEQIARDELGLVDPDTVIIDPAG